MAKDGMVAGEREEDGGLERRRAHSCKLSNIKAEIVFVSGRLTLFPHRPSKLL